jgi:hypothetical protein
VPTQVLKTALWGQGWVKASPLGSAATQNFRRSMQEEEEEEEEIIHWELTEQNSLAK